MKKTTAAKRALAMTCAAAIASFALAGTAFAATVHGADYHGTGSALESGEVDVLNVDGSAGEAVFLTVKAGDTTLAKNLPYVIGEGAGQDDDATWNGVATLDIANLDLNALDGTYTIEAYANRAGTDLLYSGALYGVYADLPDGTTKLIGTRTADAAELEGRTYQPAETLFANGLSYRLVGEVQNEGALHFAYEQYDESTTIDGVVKYTDAMGATIATTKIPGLVYGEERTVDIPAVVEAENGDMYRTVYFKKSVTAVNPGQTSFSIYCAKMSEADQALAGFYVATIQLVDQDGGVIATDTVDVTGEFIYTAPGEIYKTEVVDEGTGETAVVTYKIDGSPVIRLSAANDGIMNRARTINVAYTAQPLDASEVEVTFNLIDGSKRVNDKERILGTEKVTATDETPVVIPPDSQIEVNGMTYYLVGDPSDYAYTLHSSMVPSIDVYYTPEGYANPGAYDVTVNYVNFLTNEVIESHSYTSDADGNARIAIETPAEFSAGDVTYVRLNGQEDDIQHSYYSGIESYTVYYRDINDTLTSGTVINTIRVVYADGTTEGGAADDGTGIADAAAALAEGATALQLNAGRTYNVFDGADNNATLTNESGVDSNTERIEDSETPLASGFDAGAQSSAASSLSQMATLAVPIGVGAVVVIAIAFVVLMRLRRKNDDMYEL